MLVSCDFCGNPVTIRKAKLIQLPDNTVETRCFKCWKSSIQSLEFKPDEWEIQFPHKDS